ncbi:hypothetical protein BGZ93_010696 [Podila epicladia]|nr:hypothetical protein BGZ92_008586 [Podila epicladia]KAG0087866.1 hypothetical protein BGZ93_010696 [Podila epicladia]
MSLLKMSPARPSDLPQDLTLAPMEHPLDVISHQETFDLGMFGSDEELFADFEGNAMYSHSFEESFFGTVAPCFLPSTVPSGSTSPIHQLQLQYQEQQQKELQVQRHSHKQQQQHHRQTELLTKSSQDTFMVSPELQPEYPSHSSPPCQLSQYPHIPLSLQQQMPYIGSIHDLMEIKPVRTEMFHHRTPVLERLSSPDGSLSPTSDQDLFDSMTDDEPSLSSSYSSYTSLFSLADEHIAPPLSQLTVSCDTVVMGDPAPTSNRVRRAVPQHNYTHMTVDLSLASSSPMFSPTASTTPILSSSLKQHFSSFSDSEGPEEDESQLHGKRRKRVRRAHVKKVTQPRPSIKLPCTFSGCPIECSSQPSLARHAETHKWRGRYAPVRCEACQSALSNEFSVQRHIQRAPTTSACRKMRVYSVMRSETQVECTVRFYPKRPHGKKTVIVDLEAFRRRNLGN